LTDGSISFGGSTITSGQVTNTPQGTVTVTDNSTITCTSAVVPLTAGGAVGTANISGCATAGRVTMLHNIVAQTITITDTGTIMLEGNAALSQYDTLTLLGDGTNCLQIAKSTN
jgi:hypothetical protein